MKLILIRHGESEVNPQNLVPRKGEPVHLTEKGKEQSRLLVPALQMYDLELILSSPEIRAQETAKIIARALHIPVKTISELSERDWGDWSGKTWEEIKEALDLMSIEERYTFVPPRGESWKQAEERIGKALDTITSRKEKCVAIVTHNGVLRILMPILKNAPKESSLQYDFNNTSVTIFNYEDGKFSEVLVNDVSHLAGRL
jgi:probable phosphoglycerate mutase